MSIKGDAWKSRVWSKQYEANWERVFMGDKVVCDSVEEVKENEIQKIKVLCLFSYLKCGTYRTGAIIIKVRSSSEILGEFSREIKLYGEKWKHSKSFFDYPDEATLIRYSPQNGLWKF